MFLFRTTLFCVLFFNLCAYSKTELFHHFSTGISLGSTHPLFKLNHYLNPGTAMGVSLTTSYYKAISTRAILDYSFLTPTGRSKNPRDIDIVTMAILLMYTPKNNFLPVISLGVSNTLLNPRESSQKPLLLMDGNESEFGILPALFWRIPFSKSYSAEAGVHLNIIYSEPKYSNLLRLALAIEKTWW